MEAGRELDTRVALKVMKWKSWTDGDAAKWSVIRHWWVTKDGSRVQKKKWSPSTDIAAAWEVVEKLLPLEESEDEADICVSATFNVQFYPQKLHEMSSSEAALAICLAALKALE